MQVSSSYPGLLSRYWILTKPVGAITFKGEVRELLLGTNPGLEFIKKDPTGFRKFVEDMHFPWVQKADLSSRIKLFPHLFFPAFRNFTLKQFRDDYVNSIMAKSKVANGTIALTSHENATKDDSFKIGSACFHNSTINYSQSIGLPAGSSFIEVDDCVLFLPADDGKRWVEMRVDAQFKPRAAGEIKPELRDIVSHMEIVGERPIKQTH